MKFKPTTIQLIIASGAFLAFMFFVVALYYVINQKKTNIESLRVSLAISEKAESGNLFTKRLFENTKEERKELDAYFIAKDDTVSFVELVENLSRTAGVKISVNNVSVEQSAPKEQFEYVKVSASASGSFSKLHFFLSLLESVPIKLDITKFVFEESPDSEKDNKEWRMDVTVKALKFKN